MEAFLSLHQEKLKSVIYDVNYYEKNLKSLSSWWGRIALLGKINSLEVAATILDDMDSARSQFQSLQGNLINSLIQQHFKKVMLHHQTRCQTAINILIRNLFERTADIGFLSDDPQVKSFLTQASHDQDDLLAMRQVMQGYVDKYTVYQDALIISPQKEVLFQLSNHQYRREIRDTVIDDLLENPRTFKEYFARTDMLDDGKEHLFYLNPVMENGKVLGIIVLCFRFTNEVADIFGTLSSNDESVYLIADETGRVIFQTAGERGATVSQIPLLEDVNVFHLGGTEMLLVSTEGEAYQGYTGPTGWRACALVPVSVFKAKNIHNLDFSALPPVKDLTGIFSKELLDIRDRSTLINNDLELIVLNGVITAARNDSAEFMPVLEAIKNIGRDIDSVFANSIESLFSTILASQLDEVSLKAELAVDILDRNLYERANDCRWWALDPRLAEALLETPVNISAIEGILQSIHGLYTVYHDLYVFDDQCRYVVSSLSNTLFGKPVPEASGSCEVLRLTDSQEYSVSSFLSFECYEGKSTYIYNGAVRNPNNLGQVVGGIGTVFDAEAEFKAILEDVLPENMEKSFAVFTDDQGQVIASSSDDYSIGQVFFPDIDLARLFEEGHSSQVISFDGVYYLLGAALSKGYREFKNDDGYIEPLIAWVMLPC